MVYDRHMALYLSNVLLTNAGMNSQLTVSDGYCDTTPTGDVTTYIRCRRKSFSNKTYKDSTSSCIVSPPSPDLLPFWRHETACTWVDTAGRRLILKPVSMVTLSDKERQVLQMMAMAKLHALDIDLDLPKLKNVSSWLGLRTKRSAISLRVRSVGSALIQGIRDRSRRSLRRNNTCLDDKAASTTQVFGVSLARVTAREAGHRRLTTGGRWEAMKTKRSVKSRKKRKPSTSSGDIVEDSPSESDVLTTDTDLLDALSLSTPVTAAHTPVNSTSRSHDDAAVTSGGACAEDTSLTSHAPLVPRIVTACCSHILTHGLQQLGIFRVGSSKKRVTHLRDEVDAGCQPSLGEDTSIHDVAALLKEYFRDLPDPLLTRDLYSAFIATRKISSRDQRLTVLQLLIATLPRPNGDTLYALLTFLHTVAQHSYTSAIQAGNKMDSRNLATLFAPNLLHKAKVTGESYEVEQIERAEESADVIDVVREMIDSCELLFQMSASLHDEVLLKLTVLNSDALDYLLNYIVATNRTGISSTDAAPKIALMASSPIRDVNRKLRDEFLAQSSQNSAEKCLKSKLVEDVNINSHFGSYSTSLPVVSIIVQQPKTTSDGVIISTTNEVKQREMSPQSWSLSETSSPRLSKNVSNRNSSSSYSASRCSSALLVSSCASTAVSADDSMWMRRLDFGNVDAARETDILF